jgi:hypothetical protein
MTIKDTTMSDSGSATGDRDLDCVTYLEAGIEGLVVKALVAGWSDDEISNALLSLVQERISESRDDAVLDFGPRPGATKH